MQLFIIIIIIIIITSKCVLYGELALEQHGKHREPPHCILSTTLRDTYAFPFPRRGGQGSAQGRMRPLELKVADSQAQALSALPQNPTGRDRCVVTASRAACAVK